MAFWTKKEIAKLGTKTDREVGIELGRSQSSVEWKRLSLGIPASIVKTFSWSPAEDALLGTDADSRIAEELGVSRKTVVERRQKLSIPCYGQTGNRRRR